MNDVKHHITCTIAIQSVTAHELFIFKCKSYETLNVKVTGENVDVLNVKILDFFQQLKTGMTFNANTVNSNISEISSIIDSISEEFQSNEKDGFYMRNDLLSIAIKVEHPHFFDLIL